MNEEQFYEEAFERNPPGSVAKLADVTVGIAGAGGLGSNIAIGLLRAGIRSFIIADFDRIEMSNLNRQQYRLDQVGMVKVEALKQNMLQINPYSNISIHATTITAESVPKVFGRADIMLEAFDRAEMKAMLANSWMRNFPDRYLIMGSGLSGYGMNSKLSTTTTGKIVLCGDRETASTPENGLAAPRVAIAANMQANAALEILLTGSITP